MRKSFIITESEKKQIRKMYGLISEGREQVEEIYIYTNEYINKPGCDGIAEDVKNMNDAVQRGELKISAKSAETLKSNSNKVGMLSFACNPGKNMMKETLESNINDQSSYPDMISSACWMSKNSVRYKKNLTICNVTAPDQNINNNTPVNNSNNVQTNNQINNQVINTNNVNSQPINPPNTPVNISNQRPVSSSDNENKGLLWGRESSTQPAKRRFEF